MKFMHRADGIPPRAKFREDFPAAVNMRTKAMRAIFARANEEEVFDRNSGPRGPARGELRTTRAGSGQAS